MAITITDRNRSGSEDTAQPRIPIAKANTVYGTQPVGHAPHRGRLPPLPRGHRRSGRSARPAVLAARMTRASSPLMAPDSTFGADGLRDHVRLTGEVRLVHRAPPETTSPSTGHTSWGRTRRWSPTWISETGMSSVLPLPPSTGDDGRAWGVWPEPRALRRPGGGGSSSASPPESIRTMMAATSHSSRRTAVMMARRRGGQRPECGRSGL